MSCGALTCTSFMNGTVSDAELNYLDGATSNVQTQLNNIVTVNNTQNTDIDALEVKTTQQSYTTGLTTFAGDLECNNLNVNDNILSTPLDAVNDASYSSVSFPSTFSLSPYNGTDTGSLIITGEST